MEGSRGLQVADRNPVLVLLADVAGEERFKEQLRMELGTATALVALAYLFRLSRQLPNVAAAVARIRKKMLNATST